MQASLFNKLYFVNNCRSMILFPQQLCGALWHLQLYFWLWHCNYDIMILCCYQMQLNRVPNHICSPTTRNISYILLEDPDIHHRLWILTSLTLSPPWSAWWLLWWSGYPSLSLFQRMVPSVLILLNLYATFNRVDHEILLSILSDLGIPWSSTSWFASYPMDRSYQVSLRRMQGLDGYGPAT